MARTLLVIAAGAGLVLLTVRLHPSFALLAGIPLLQRLLASARAARAAAGPSPGQRSEVATRFLRMSIDHDSGVMTGVVLEGRFAGRRVEDLSREELLELLARSRSDDPQSASILESYLDRTVGGDWRQEESDANRGGGKDADGGQMSERQALEVLGLGPGASENEIVEAHRRLMQRVHPDRGGSDYLAAQLNRAKGVLLRT